MLTMAHKSTLKLDCIFWYTLYNPYRIHSPKPSRAFFRFRIFKSSCIVFDILLSSKVVRMKTKTHRLFPGSSSWSFIHPTATVKKRRENLLLRRTKLKRVGCHNWTNWQNIITILEGPWSVFVDGNIERKLYTISDPTRSSFKKCNCRSSAALWQESLRFWCSALTNWATESSCRALTTSSCIYWYIVYVYIFQLNIIIPILVTQNFTQWGFQIFSSDISFR